MVPEVYTDAQDPEDILDSQGQEANQVQGEGKVNMLLTDYRALRI